MTKFEATGAMLQGKKVRHSSFAKGEWITSIGLCLIIDSAGLPHKYSSYWYWRDSPIYNSNWSIHE